MARRPRGGLATAIMSRPVALAALGALAMAAALLPRAADAQACSCADVAAKVRPRPAACGAARGLTAPGSRTRQLTVRLSPSRPAKAARRLQGSWASPIRLARLPRRRWGGVQQRAPQRLGERRAPWACWAGERCPGWGLECTMCLGKRLGGAGTRLAEQQPRGKNKHACSPRLGKKALGCLVLSAVEFNGA